jgi:hypothetical protein
MPDDSREEPDPSDETGDEFRDLLREFLAGNTNIDPAQLASAAGLPDDPAAVERLIQQLQSALSSSTQGVNWGLALEQATTIANHSTVVSLPAERSQLEQALHVASLWLDEATFVSALTTEPRLMSRTEWATASMPIWIQLAEPVASSIANSLAGVSRHRKNSAG